MRLFLKTAFALALTFMVHDADTQQASASSMSTHGIDLKKPGAGDANLDIKSYCVNGIPTFKIFNRGDRWPQMGTLKVYKVQEDGLKAVSEREMRFGKGQTASFRLKTAG